MRAEIGELSMYLDVLFDAIEESGGGAKRMAIETFDGNMDRSPRTD